MMSPTARKHKVWMKIAELMQTYGYSVSGEQCKNNFKAMVTAYKKAKDNNKKSGNSTSTSVRISQ